MRMLCLALSLIILFQHMGQAQSDKIKMSDDVELVILSDRVYVHISYFETNSFGRVGANGLLLIDDGKAFLFDSPWDNEQTEILTSWLSDSLNVTITDFVPNHWHGDCMGGLEYLHNRNVVSHANQMTIDIAKSEGLPVPLNGFEDSLHIRLNDIDVFCYYLGGGHSTDNIVVWIPSEKVLFPGCLVKDLQATNLGNLSDAALNEWPNTIDNVIAKFPSAEIIVPGHGAHGGKELLGHTKKLLLESVKL